MVGGGGVHIAAFRGGVVKSGFHKSKSISHKRKQRRHKHKHEQKHKNKPTYLSCLAEKKSKQPVFTLGSVIAQLLVGPSKQLNQIIQTKHNNC